MNNNNLLSEGLLQNHNDENNEEQWIDIDDDDDENEDVRNWGNTPHNNAEGWQTSVVGADAPPPLVLQHVADKHMG